MQDHSPPCAGYFFRRLRRCVAVAGILGGLVSIGCAPRTACTERLAETSVQPCVQVVEEFHADGAIRLRKEVIQSINGESIDHGKYTQWYPDGTREYEAQFIGGKKCGATTRWHSNGRKWIEQSYGDGVIHGISRTWDEQGRLRSEQHFDSGMPCGIWTDWDKEGRIKSQQNFHEATRSPR